MRLKCPVCKTPLTEHLLCENGHQFYKEDDVMMLMTPEFKSFLHDWLDSFEEYRSPYLKRLDFEHLPVSGLNNDFNIWSARIQDINLIDKQIEHSFKTVLEIGSWNGWLANHLSKKGLEVIAIDYFTHELDGMKAKRFYSNPSWTSIQMDLEDLSILDQPFDLIILNRCLAYFTDPINYLFQLQKLIKPGGKIIITGLNVKKNQMKERELIQSTIEFKSRYNKDLQFKNSKSYIDFNDLEDMKKWGAKIACYPGFKNRINSTFFKHKNVTYFGIYIHKNVKTY